MHVVGRRHAHGVVRLQVVPVEHAPLVLVGAADAHVIAFLRERDLVVMDVGGPSAPDHLHGNLVRGRRPDGDVAEVGIDRERSSRLNVEVSADGVARRGARGNGEQREGQGYADGANPMHDVTSDGCYYAAGWEKLAGRAKWLVVSG